MTRRTQRVSSLLKDTIAEVIPKHIADPRIDPALLSITSVEVPEDLLTAKVGVSVIGSDSDARRTVRALNHAAGKIQELMGRKIRLRHTPQLRFELDEKYKKTLETLGLIEQAMQEIREKEQDNDVDDESSSLPDQTE